MHGSLPPTLRVLSFGASITAGFYRFGLAHHPYSIRLQERLQSILPSRNVEIDIDALSGDTVIQGTYFSRLGSRCLTKERDPYDWVIIQGGGNDLGVGHAPEQIYEELKKIWKIALDSGAKVMALTITETSDRTMRTRARYQALNGMIMAHREDGFYVADVCTAIPWPDTQGEQGRIWDDGLHFQALGYDMLGDAIGDRLIDILQKSQSAKI
ncbi:MAG: hypothetical protein Q9163_005038 [Psora crenata]